MSQPLLLGLFLILTFPLVSYLADQDRGKKNMLQASSGGDLTSVHLDLRNDGTFKLRNSGPFGGSIYRGHYTLRNDTLRIDNGDLNLYPSLTFVMKLDTIKNERYFDPLARDTTEETIYKLYIKTGYITTR